MLGHYSFDANSYISLVIVTQKIFTRACHLSYYGEYVRATPETCFLTDNFIYLEDIFPCRINTFV